LYISFKLDAQHNILKIFTIFFALSILLIIPRVLIDYPSNCSLVVGTQNISTVVGTHISNTTTSLGYTTYCGTSKDSATIFLSSQMALFYIIMIYVLFYGGYYLYKKFIERGRVK
jgi:hypothetical protein